MWWCDTCPTLGRKFHCKTRGFCHLECFAGNFLDISVNKGRFDQMYLPCRQMGSGHLPPCPRYQSCKNLTAAKNNESCGGAAFFCLRSSHYFLLPLNFAPSFETKASDGLVEDCSREISNLHYAERYCNDQSMSIHTKLSVFVLSLSLPNLNAPVTSVH